VASSQDLRSDEAQQGPSVLSQERADQANQQSQQAKDQASRRQPRPSAQTMPADRTTARSFAA